MAVVPMVVQAEFWAGGPQGTPGSYLVRAGTVVDINTNDAAMVAFYGGMGNLAPLPANQTGDDADHSTLEN